MNIENGLYLITPEKIVNYEEIIEKLILSIQNCKISMVQLRFKNNNPDIYYNDIKNAYKILSPILKEQNIPFILNDNPKLAKELNFDGVHIGKDDGSILEARKILNDKIIGTSCYDLVDKAYEDIKNTANYIAFGAFFETKTKITTARPKPYMIDELRQRFLKDKYKYKICGIGGLNSDRLNIFDKYKPDLIAMVSNIWDRKNDDLVYELKKIDRFFKA